MKKKLLFTSAMALLLAGCAQDELGQLEQSQVEGKGISFVASIGEGANTRAEYEGAGNVFNHKWYADKDKIGVFYKENSKVKPLQGQAGLAIENGGWMGLKNSSESNSFEFKATASGTTGYFIANGDANTLWLDAPDDPTKGYTETELPEFRAYYPLEIGSRQGFVASSKINISSYAADAQAQSTIDGHGIADKAFMVSEAASDATYDANDNSVAKNRFSLKLQRVNPIVYFKILAGGADAKALNKEYERDYAEDLFTRFGKLKTVQLTAEGNADVNSGAASKLTYHADATWDMAATDLYDHATAFTPGGDGAAAITTTLNTTSGLDWSNEAVAFMSIANVDRAAFRTAEKKETVTATYTFEKIQFETSIETDKNWSLVDDKDDKTAELNWIGFPTQAGYDLDKEPYIAYEYSNGEYAIEVNPSYTGTLAELFNSGGLIDIKKEDGSQIAKTDITHFVSKKDITTTADFATIKSLTALTNVTLLKNTSISAEAFAGLSSLVYLNLPMVTTVTNVNAFPENNYTDVYMGSYNFSDKANTNQTEVRDRLLLKKHLKKADISAVSHINAGFPTSGVTFTGYEALTDITVKPGVIIGGAAFKGCSKLLNVEFPKGTENGTVTLDEGANSQFMGCTVLPKISISNTVIPDMAFNDCKALATITGSNGKAIVPTAIGISAFAATAIVDMDLSTATTIGTAAFKGCAVLVGNNKLNSARTVLYVNGVTHVSDEVFSGCTTLKYISFAKATTIGVDILKSVTCTEIEFLKPFTVNSTEATIDGTTEFFGITDDTKLFCAKAQTGISVNDITLTGNADESAAVKTSFGNITRYAE